MSVKVKKEYKSSGFTIIEVFIAVLIGGIMTFSVGIMLLAMNKQFIRSEKNIGLHQNYRFGKKMIEHELRKAQQNVVLTASELTFTNTVGDNMRIRLNSGAVWVENLTTGSNKITFENVIAFTFSYPEAPNTDIVGVYVEQELAINPSSNAVVTSSGTFVVGLRNRE